MIHETMVVRESRKMFAKTGVHLDEEQQRSLRGCIK